VRLDLDLQVATACPALPAAADFRRWARAALAGRTGTVGVVIRLVDEGEGRSLNRDYRGHDRPTNVLSFPFEAPPQVPSHHLGDLVICVPVVEREAREQGKPVAAHWAHLVVHGLLHLLGFDHQNDEDAGRMEALEARILGTLGYPDPYGARAQDL
jgi:probable rRNA maturation factor